MPSTSDLEHLLRRAEYVARPERVAALSGLTLEAVVADIVAVPSNPGSANLTESDNWPRAEQLTHYWFDRMAHDSPRPIQEKMAFFWHGHFCSDLPKVGSADLLRQQIDGFRSGALGNLRDLAVTMSTQVAMLRYLDNNQNKQDSPNQNFARELMELFLLGVGSYTEADVEAATAAWTGHTDDWRSDHYVWEGDWHDDRPKSFLGRTINNCGDPTKHGAETITVILGDGVVPSGAPINAGRPSREVAAEFISKKLWIEFAGTEPSAGVVAALRDVALANDFAITPWLTRLFTLDEFYAADVKTGLVRSPVDYVVAVLVATGQRSTDVTPLWLMDGMGQRPLFPPNVNGWGHNGYWVNASAMARRTEATRFMAWQSMSGYWNGDGRVHLKNGDITRDEVDNVWKDDPLRPLDRYLELTDLRLTPQSYDALATYSRNSPAWDRWELFNLILLAPDTQVA